MKGHWDSLRFKNNVHDHKLKNSAIVKIEEIITTIITIYIYYVLGTTQVFDVNNSSFRDYCPFIKNGETKVNWLA